MYSQSKEKMRSGARKGAAKKARMARQKRRVQVSRALEVNGSLMNISELVEATGRTRAVVTAALKEHERIEKIGTQYRLKPLGS